MSAKTMPEQHGLVVSYFGNSVAVETADGQVFPCHLRRNQELPVVGDRVVWMQSEEGAGIVLRIEPRRSVIARGDQRGKATIKPIAANVDHIIIVMAPPPIFSEHLVDRYLMAAELLNIKPIIVLNKIDLLNETSHSAAVQRLAAYQDVPYSVALISARSGEGLAKLSDLLASRSAVLVGPSGVGKSSIIAALTGSDTIRTSNVSPRGAGKHTTTATRFYHLPQGGSLIDSPGVREFHLWPVTRQEILQGFKEFQPFLGGCKFRDCQHLSEPGCKVQAAVADGKISPLRYAHYQELMKRAVDSQKSR